MLIIGDIVLLLFAYYLYIVWDKRAIRLRCEACQEIVLSSTPWVCGACHHENRKTDEFPFIHRCASCSAAPKAYQCHHCFELIFLSDDTDVAGYAYRLDSPAETPEIDDHATRMKKLTEQMAMKNAQIDLAKATSDLAAIRTRLKMGKKKRPKDVLETEIEAIMALEEAATELKAKYTKKYKKNRAMRDRMILALEDSVRRQKVGM